MTDNSDSAREHRRAIDKPLFMGYGRFIVLTGCVLAYLGWQPAAPGHTSARPAPVKAADAGKRPGAESPLFSVTTETPDEAAAWSIRPLDQAVCRIQFHPQHRNGLLTSPAPRSMPVHPGNHGGLRALAAQATQAIGTEKAPWLSVLGAPCIAPPQV